jgi:hypothetical protein
MIENMASTELKDAEIILNLWFVYDDLGLIYSLRVRAYVGTGTQEEKLALLQKFSLSDYLIAQPFPVPERFSITVVGEGTTRMPVTSAQVLRAVNEIALFEDAIREIERQLPAQTDLTIPRRPLVCLTPLQGDESGSIRPVFDGTERL